MKSLVPSFRARRNLRSIAMLGIGGVVLALMSVLGGGSVAYADGGTASVSGTVTDASTSAPIAGVEVNIQSSDFSYFDETVTADDGTYTLSTIPAGSYTLQFFSPDGSAYVQQCWRDLSCLGGSPTYFDVENGQVLTSFDAQLVPGASISGTVYAADNPGVGLSGVQVQADGSSDAESAVTDDNGNYTITNLPAGSYQVQFQGSGNYLSQWWDNQNDANLANDVTVTAGGSVTGIDASLSDGGTISGVVTDTSGNPIANVNVSAQTADGLGSGFGTTDSSGAYSISGLPPAEYQVQFEPTGGNLVGQYWDDQPTSETANPVDVEADAVAANVNAQLAAGASISGTISTADGPLKNASVTAVPISSDPNSGRSATTDAHGKYTIVGLADGSYNVEFSGPFTKNLATQWWNDAPSLADAKPVAVTSSSLATGIDATMSTGAVITGHVWAPGAAGSPTVGAAGVTVNVLSAATGQLVAGNVTNASGQYRIKSLAPGTYTIEFTTGFKSGMVDDEWWGGTFIHTGAKTLTLTAGQVATDISQRLIVGSPITGTVEMGGSSPAPAAHVEVDIWESDQTAATAGGTPFQTLTDASGNYTLPNVGPGKYTIDFLSLDAHFTGQWWNDKPTQAKANWVVVQRNVPVSGVDVTLAPVVISPGTPTITGGARVGNTLTAHPGSWKPSGMTFTYQWLDKGSPISGATATTYVPTAGEVGDTLAVAVTGTTTAYQSQGLSETVDSGATAPLKGPAAQ